MKKQKETRSEADVGLWSILLYTLLEHIASVVCIFLISNNEFLFLYVQVFDLYGVGLRQSFSTPNLLKELNLKVIISYFGGNVEYCSWHLMALFVILGFFFLSILTRKVLLTILMTLICVPQVGKLSTGDSLDMSPQDEASISANDATVKDMEVSWTFLNFPYIRDLHIVDKFRLANINPITKMVSGCSCCLCGRSFESPCYIC